jgi:hypothetical protein
MGFQKCGRKNTGLFSSLFAQLPSRFRPVPIFPRKYENDTGKKQNMVPNKTRFFRPFLYLGMR